MSIKIAILAAMVIAADHRGGFSAANQTAGRDLRQGHHQDDYAERGACHPNRPGFPPWPRSTSCPPWPGWR